MRKQLRKRKKLYVCNDFINKQTNTMAKRKIEKKKQESNANEVDDKPFEIPMDDAIQSFYYHLKSHPRTIFSAKFGDGKTYFLKKFKEVATDKAMIITIHPVNYQVVENKDVFELIKRDILFQITLNQMLDENLEISDLVAWLFYIQNNFMDVTESVVSFLSLLQAPPTVATGILAALKGTKLFKDLRQKVKNIKKEYKSTDALDAFIDQCNNISVLEEDIVTQIIQDSIDEFKSQHQQTRVVLVIEDMDRLDPAHLFRIMNVFSAHLDTNERMFKEEKDFRLSNKFHFDNVVFVMDYENTEKIYKHFYGADTSFDGYIEKFVTKGFFKYSIKELAYESFLIERVSQIIALPKDFVRSIIQPECIKDKSLRAIANSIEGVDFHLKRPPVYQGRRIDWRILRLYAIMKNLEIDGTVLINNFREAIINNHPILMYYLGLFIDVSFAIRPSKEVEAILLKEHNSSKVGILASGSFDRSEGCYRINKLLAMSNPISESFRKASLLANGLALDDSDSVKGAFSADDLLVVLNDYVA